MIVKELKKYKYGLTVVPEKYLNDHVFVCSFAVSLSIVLSQSSIFMFLFDIIRTPW